MAEAKLTVKEIAVMGVMIAVLMVSVHIMAPLPNIEPVTLLVMLYTLFFGKKTAYILAAYILLEGCWYGFGIWWVMYLYVWPLLAVLTYLLRKKESVFVYATLAGAFGLFYGALCAIPYLFVGGPATAFAWWVAGVPYDLIHCISNVIICLVLFRPLNAVLKRLRRELYPPV